MNNSRSIRKTYRIRVGHFDLRVEAQSPEEAIRSARRRLSREYPLLYDLIRTLDPLRFQFREAA